MGCYTTQIRTEHAGPKNRGAGFWGRKALAKSFSRKARRINSRKIITEALSDVG